MKDTTIAVGSCKERLRDCHLGRSGEGVQATPCESTQVGVVFCQTERCHRASRSLRLCSTSGQGRSEGWDTTSSLLPPHLVRPYRRGSKNDRADAKALLEVR